MSPPALVEGTAADVPVDDLLLDAQNPRLASHDPTRPSQEDMLRILWSEMAVDEVAFSIAANGFYSQEPLFVIPIPGRNASRYTVIEGNRRLAAVRLLRDENLRISLKATDLPRIRTIQESNPGIQARRPGLA